MTRDRIVAGTVLATLGILASLSAARAPSRGNIDPRTPESPDARPFSGAVRVGPTLYLSGVIGVGEDRRVPDDPAEEARNALNMVRARLEQAGLTMDDLVSVQVFCSDVAHYATFNDVYRGYFRKEFPARAFIGSGKLLFGARFEIQGIAAER